MPVRRHGDAHFAGRAVSRGSAGKTTLLDALSGRVTFAPVKGTVLYGGVPLTSDLLSFVPQFDDHNRALARAAARPTDRPTDNAPRADFFTVQEALEQMYRFKVPRC